ncbi:MAG TPA: archease, partial [Anaerolineaceae bacterium]|nr:archease [Anaerolineaceae bacterium]
AESLLVTFLGELLFLAEDEGLGFDQIDLTLEGLGLRAELRGAPIAGQSKLIKAVTFHKLAVFPTSSGLETTIVFDV